MLLQTCVQYVIKIQRMHICIILHCLYWVTRRPKVEMKNIKKYQTSINYCIDHVDLQKYANFWVMLEFPFHKKMSLLVIYIS